MLSRPRLLKRIEQALAHYPVTLLLGPRQCGKTTLARQICDRHQGDYFDLEDPETALRPEIAKTVLKDLDGLVVIDEIQRQPELFALLRVLADRRPRKARFLILGSASPTLARGASESLAGRVSLVSMGGFTLDEINAGDIDKLWLRGGFPPAFLAPDDSLSLDWRLNFIQTFLERDVPQLGIRVPAPTLRRFWVMLAHYHNQIHDHSKLAAALGVSPNTIRHYLDILDGAFMLRQLPPWWANIKKRLVKRPKVAVRDSGLLHALLGLSTREQLLSHPIVGHSWEGFAQEQIISLTGCRDHCFFYKVHQGPELDLLINRHGRSYGFECKLLDAPTPTRAMHRVIEDLELAHLFVIYPGERRFPLADRITALPLTKLVEALGEYRLI